MAGFELPLAIGGAGGGELKRTAAPRGRQPQLRRYGSQPAKDISRAGIRRVDSTARSSDPCHSQLQQELCRAPSVSSVPSCSIGTNLFLQKKTGLTELINSLQSPQRSQLQ